MNDAGSDEAWDISLIALDVNSSKPLILLDVDGVISKILGGMAWKDEQEARVCDARVRYSPTVVELLNSFVRDGLAEIRWLTSWGKDAREQLAPAIGLDDFLTARDAAWDPSKDTVAKDIAVACPNRPVVWIDDEVKFYSMHDKAFWAQRPRTLLVQPKNNLSREDLEQMRRFLEECRDDLLTASGIPES